MGYGLSIWNTVYRYNNLPYGYGHPGYRYGIWSNDMGDDIIDMVILHIDMGYRVTTLVFGPVSRWSPSFPFQQGLTLPLQFPLQLNLTVC
jgi:hypothetical protein